MKMDNIKTEFNFRSLNQALNSNIKRSRCFVYCLTVAGEKYIGFTSRKPETRLKEHIKSAMVGSKLKVHRALRSANFQYTFEIISEHENEILALVAEINAIKDHKAKLNVSSGGYGPNFKVFQNKHFDYIVRQHSQKGHYSGKNLKSRYDKNFNSTANASEEPDKGWDTDEKYIFVFQLWMVFCFLIFIWSLIS